MEPKEIDFEFTRGDTCPIKFTLLDEEKQEIHHRTGDELYFTVKQSYSSEDIIFQKRMSLGEITQENGEFSLTILPEDTQNLNYGSYVYDLCYKSGEYTHTPGIGTITLTNEVTFAKNE